MAELKIEVEHSLGDIVFLKTDKEQLERIVIKYIINPLGILYVIAQGTGDYAAYGCEISKEKSGTKKVGFN